MTMNYGGHFNNTVAIQADAKRRNLVQLRSFDRFGN